MKIPEQDSIDSWVSRALRTIEKRKKYLDSGWYQKEDLPMQTYFGGLADDYADLGRSYFLNGEPLYIVREAFSKGAKNMLQCFTMAYNKNDFHYVGDKQKRDDQINAGYGQVDWGDVGETSAIDGLNFALMGADFETAHNLAYWYQDRPDGHKMDEDVNRYIYAYKYIILGETDKAIPLLQTTIDHYQAKPPNTIGDMNYFTLSLILQGIAKKDAHQVNESLLLHLEFYQKSAIPSEDYWDTDLEFICDDAVALANLAIHVGIKVTAEHDLLPRGLLI